jgi:mRNA interferase RelE/StbE
LSYTIQFKPAALRQLEKLPRNLQKRIASKIEALRDEPFPSGCKKLFGEPDTWRVRIGNYRAIYRVHRKVLLILVITIGHRRDVYR